MIKRDEFIDFLEDYMQTEEAKELEIQVTGNEEEDAPLINSMQKANYFLGLIKKINEDIENTNSYANEYIEKVIDKVNTFKESQIAPLVKQKVYFEKLLKNFTENEIANSNKKTIKLPNGNLSLRRQQPEWKYEEDLVIEWLLQNSPEHIKTVTTAKLDKKAVKAHANINEDGSIALNDKQVPGIKIEQQEDKFVIK